MAKVRSPVLGYNHNIRHLGWLFHVQTEDSGVQSPHIFTHLFHSGVILTSRKYKYDPELDETAVKLLMQSQHKSVLKELKSGKLDEKIHQYLKDHPKEKDAPEGDQNWQVNEPGRAETQGDPPPPEPEKRKKRESIQFMPTASPGSMVSFDAPAPVDADVTEKNDQPAPTDPPSQSPAQRLAGNALATVPPPIPADAGGPSRRADTVLDMSPPIPPPSRKTASRGSGGDGVVVSPPSVIVGGPPKRIGAPEEDGAVEGPLISEKSLDEVILAYLSEDSKDDI